MKYIVDALKVKHEVEDLGWFDNVYKEIEIKENGVKLLVKPENIHFKKD